MKILITLGEGVGGGRGPSIQKNKDISDFIIITTTKRTEQINVIRRM